MISYIYCIVTKSRKYQHPPNSLHRQRIFPSARRLDARVARHQHKANTLLKVGNATNLPPRPALNMNGQEISVGLNSWKVFSFPKEAVFQYDVLITPLGNTKMDADGPNRGVMSKIWKSNAVQTAIPRGMVYDGNKLAWCLKDISQLRVDIDLDKERDPTKESRGRNCFRFAMKKSTTVKFDVLTAFLNGQASWTDQCLEAIAFLDHLMRETPSTKFFSFRRSFFSKNNDRLMLGGGAEAFKGVYASIRCAFYGGNLRGLSVNVDVSNGTFWAEQDLITAMTNATGISSKDQFQRTYKSSVGPGWRKSNLYQSLKRLHRVKVFSDHRGVRDEYTIERFDDQDVTQHRFTKDDGSTVTLQQYYRETYRKNPETGLPVCLMTRKIGPADRKKHIAIPIDVLRIGPFQRYNTKLDDRQTSSMIKFAVTLPAERLRAIETGIKSLDWAADPYLTNYGVKIDAKRTEVKARLLPAPDVVFANGNIPSATVGQGRWVSCACLSC